MEQSSNKTIMCSVFFLDIVGYSKRSVTGQISLKERFNAYLSAAIRDVPLSDRLILDTGDGAAINFMGDIEDALKAALSMRSSMLHEDPNIEPPLLVRMGVNLGPVRLIRDINGQPNIVGDGINVAQRVMGFADASQILVSRSYFDAVSRLSPQYAGMFHYQGSRTDKHVREHEVYAIGYPGDKTTRPFAVHDGVEKPVGRFDKYTASLASVLDLFLQKLDASFDFLADYYQGIHVNKRPLFVAALGVPLVLLIAFGAKLALREDAISVQPAAKSRVNYRDSKMIVPASGVVANEEKRSHKVGKSSLRDQRQVRPITPPRSLTEKEKLELASTRALTKLFGFSSVGSGGARGKIALSCSSGAMLFVDGAQKGKITSGEVVAEVTSGKHIVIVKLPNQKLFTRTMDVPSGETLSIHPKMCH